jgi:hypothetical protein
MDWIEARQEAMKLEEEDEQEEEQREADAAQERENSKQRQLKKAATSGANTPLASTSVSGTDMQHVDSNRASDNAFTAPPPTGIRQRDALVRAVELARSRSRSASAQNIPTSATAPAVLSAHNEETGVTAAQSEPVMRVASSPVPVSSPAVPSSPMTTFTTRPLKPYPLHHQKSTGRMTNMKVPSPNNQFKPSLPESIPFFPLFQTSASMDAFDEVDHDASIPSSGSLESSIGGKRSHESVFGGTTGVNSFTARHSSGRRRGGNGGERDTARHHGGKGIFGGMDGVDPSSEDDRQRKRQTRR